ncbi:MAG: FkbM family methyltransferase [Bacteroidales bacterium]|nr:FkbM family methyltransferase [Bacteroidales bacterium]
MIRRIIKYLRLHYPAIYFSVVGIYDKLRSGKKSIHIFDNCGGSFKEYISKENMEQRLEALKKGMDEYSLHTVDVLYQRLLNYPEHHYGIKINTDYSKVVGGLLKEESTKSRKKVKSGMSKIKQQFKFARNNMDASVFYFNHGLIFLPEGVKNYLIDQHFIDLGAYFGDSALALTKYGYSKIFSVEFSPKAIENYKVWMKANKIDNSKYVIVEAAMSSSDDDPPIYMSGNDYTLFSDKLSSEENAVLKVQKRSLDSIVDEYKIQPKLIKADIEGYVLECMKGAVNTLKKYRPVLSLAIYHNPKEFFETKPFLESILDNYSYMIRKMAVTPFGLRSHAETILVAYPNEIVS